MSVPRTWVWYIAGTIATFAAVGVVGVAGGGAMFSPGPLTARAAAKTPHGNIHSHAELADNCAACHPPMFSSTTMADRCIACHEDVRAQIDARSSHHGRMPNGRACRDCHFEHRGAEVKITNRELFDHGWTDFPLTGKHLGVLCSNCHTNAVRKEASATCAACHAEPKVHFGKFGNQCATCHATDTWKGSKLGTPLGNGPLAAGFDHSKTGFPLTGKHTSTDCKSCHTSGAFRGTSTSCVSCHAEPKVHLGKFGVGCADCHQTANWKGAALALLGGKGPGGAAVAFDHDKTHFKLTGKHRGVGCAACHKAGSFVDTSQSCVSCHAEPKMHAGLFNVDCMKCHTTNEWKGAAVTVATAANFDHDKTHFKLTGKHRGISCAGCHKGGETFAIAADKQSCFACHAEPKVHKGMLGVDCAKCHSSLSWKGATFAHKFPLNHGAGRKGAASGCVTCHQNPENVAVYTCYGCHAHTKERVAQQHRGRQFMAAVLEKCAKCHPTGRERDRRGALDESSPLDRLLDPSAQLGRVDDLSIPDHAAIIRRFILSGGE